MNSEIKMLEKESIKTPVYSKIKRTTYQTTKRIFDILCSLIGCIFLIPLAIIVKISYLLTGDFDSIFFTQKRIGKDGKEFTFFKFRTMVPNADEILFRTLELDKIAAEEYKKNRKFKKDPRITKMGGFLRKTSLDEMPQMINVFLGDMSMIGNRPYLPREKEDMGEHFDVIVKTKPGITGYWQVNGRSNTTFKKRLELEEYYSEHASLILDIKIFIKTFVVVFGTKGAD